MNKSERERLFQIMQQIEQFVAEIEELQNKEYGNYSKIANKNSVKRQTLENNCWLMQPIHDSLENVLSEFEVVEDLIDADKEKYDIACYMANYYKRDLICQFPYEKIETHYT